MGSFSVFDHGPRSGPHGTVITVTGAGFTSATAARFGAAQAPQDIEANILSDDRLQIIIPNDAPLGVCFFSIQNPEPGASSVMVFTVTERA